MKPGLTTHYQVTGISEERISKRTGELFRAIYLKKITGVKDGEPTSYKTYLVKGYHNYKRWVHIRIKNDAPLVGAVVTGLFIKNKKKRILDADSELTLVTPSPRPQTPKVGTDDEKKA